jgi:hypothetical protein
MRAKTAFSTGVVEQEKHAAELDLVVPFTTPELTRAALDAANRMGAGLNPTIRLIRVQAVPYPLQLDQSPVYIEFLKEQIAKLPSGLPVAGEIRLARSFEDGLLGTLGSGSIVILATPKRPWTTRNERLARALRRAGHMVVLVTPGAFVETKQEPVHA